MKIKIHLSIVVLFLVFLGTYLEQSNVPNQQIVVQFSNKTISPQLSDETIDVVSKQLAQLGAENIQIGEQKDGQLKITYFSNQEVKDIQGKLFAKNKLQFSLSPDKDNSDNLPAKKDAKDYLINVSEIESNSNTAWDFEGTLVIEQSQKSDRFSNTEVEFFTGTLISKCHNLHIANVFQVNTSVVHAIDTFSYKIPETRAGPLS